MKAAARLWSAVLFGVAAAASSDGRAQAPSSDAQHSIVSADAVPWKPLRPGAEIAVVSGDPNKEGSPFVMRFRYRGKARIPPHWHPVDEHITVLSGTFLIGMGERGDESATTALGAGAYAFVPAKMAHYAWTTGDTLVQIHGIGPFSINYVNPADDPGKAGKMDRHVIGDW
jgi:quercetin dioxygenase-like cupin family protein